MRPALPVLLFALLLITTGCLGVFGPSRPPSDQRALDTVSRSQAAMANVTSYRFTLDGHMEATNDDESLSFDVAGSGAVNVSRQRLNATIRARESSRSTYITDDTVYTECSRMGWGRENLTRSIRWLNYTPVGEQLALLDRTNVYWRGTETVDGTPAAVVTAAPTKRELESVTDAKGTGETGIGTVKVQNVTVTVWMSTETDRVLKAQREIRINRGGTTATATMTFRFTDYNEPIVVTRPTFDEDAVWTIGCPGS